MKKILLSILMLSGLAVFTGCSSSGDEAKEFVAELNEEMSNGKVERTLEILSPDDYGQRMQISMKIAGCLKSKKIEGLNDFIKSETSKIQVIQTDMGNMMAIKEFKDGDKKIEKSDSDFPTKLIERKKLWNKYAEEAKVSDVTTKLIFSDMMLSAKNKNEYFQIMTYSGSLYLMNKIEEKFPIKSKECVLETSGFSKIKNIGEPEKIEDESKNGDLCFFVAVEYENGEKVDYKLVKKSTQNEWSIEK